MLSLALAKCPVVDCFDCGLSDKIWSTIESESCVVIRDDGTKRRQRILNV